MLWASRWIEDPPRMVKRPVSWAVFIGDLNACVTVRPTALGRTVALLRWNLWWLLRQVCSLLRGVDLSRSIPNL
jgi:hypothetical protein